MKKFLKIFSVFCIGFFVVFAGLYFFVRAKGKDILTVKMSYALQRPVTIGGLSVIFPLGLNIKDLNVQGYGYIKEVRIGSGLFYLLGNYFSFSSLVLTEPHIVVQRTEGKQIVFGDGQNNAGISKQAAQSTEGALQQAVAKLPAKTPGFSFDKVIIKGGKINFLDNSSPENTARILIDRVDIKAHNVSFPPRDKATKFVASGFVLGQLQGGGPGRIESHGWVNLVKKDMKSDLRIKDLNGKIFSQYFGGNSMDKNIKSMSVNLTADLESKNNDVSVQGKVTVGNVVLNTDKEKDKKPSFEDMILGSLQSITQGISIDFSFKTKMDSFKIDSFSFSGNIFN